MSTSRMIPERPRHPTTLVVFGGTGDLATSKLLPALFSLYSSDGLPERFALIGLARGEHTDASYQDWVGKTVRAALPEADTELVTAFAQCARYIAGDFSTATTYEAVRDRLATVDEEFGQCANKLFYLAVPPSHYATMFGALTEHQLLELCDNQSSWARLLVEKPFGRDLETAQALEAQLCDAFAEEQIYRIDHYLAKDAIENVLALRFANSVFAAAWEPSQIQSIVIRKYETAEVATRGVFYDGMGALRDVGQNHLLQILALITMAPADVQSAAAVRAARGNALTALTDTSVTNITRAQYAGYRDIGAVADDSTTETFIHTTFQYTAGPWEGVHVTLEAGKALDRDVTEAEITFAPNAVCRTAFPALGQDLANQLRVRFAPEQQLALSLWRKEPGFTFAIAPEEVTLSADTGTDADSPTAYARVLYDCLVGDQTRFVSGQEVEAAWQFITPLLERLSATPLAEYEPGTPPPTEVDERATATN